MIPLSPYMLMYKLSSFVPQYSDGLSSFVLIECLHDKAFPLCKLILLPHLDMHHDRIKLSLMCLTPIAFTTHLSLL